MIDIRSSWVAPYLDLLLQDKSTKKNIIWATDTYEEYGDGFRDKEQITRTVLLQQPDIIKPRIQKSLEAQQARTRKKAEVFTPAWLCNRMNNCCDETWFRRKNVFNIESGDHNWETVEDTILFPKRKKWQHYVDSKRLEITCGEAPYLVSRYDVSTGEEILPTKHRIGQLDRKLRIVNEHTENYDEWVKWTIRAFEASYGYEYQGDNLLIARMNLLMTFLDYHQERWDREPDEKLIKTIIRKIVWNIWQMDGLKDTVPLGKPYEEFHQMTLADFLPETGADPKEEHDAILCKTYNWRKNNSAVFKKLKESQIMGKKMFDFIIGNPPYQESDGGAGASATPVYNKFIEASKTLNPDVMSYIIPAKWYSGGKGLDDFRKAMLSDPHIAVLEDYTNSGEVFPGVDVAGGVCYFIRDQKHVGGVLLY